MGVYKKKRVSSLTGGDTLFSLTKIIDNFINCIIILIIFALMRIMRTKKQKKLTNHFL